MFQASRSIRRVVCALAFSAMLPTMALANNGTVFSFTYTGLFTGDSCVVAGASGGTCNSGNELNVGGYVPFTVSGTFNTGTGNEVASVSGRPGGIGFLAYRTTDAVISFSGVSYTFDPTGQDISFAMFPQNSGFGPPSPTAVAAGILLNAITDQNGSIGDFSSMTNPFTTAVAATVFQTLNGAGQGPASGYGTIILDSGGQQFSLELNHYQSVASYALTAFSASDYSAVVPEPASALLMAPGMLLLLRRRRR